MVGESKHRAEVWEAVDALIDRAPSLQDLREHRLHILAERHWSRTGKPIPAPLAAEKRLAAARSLPIPSLLARVAAAWDGRMVVLKGPELASRYPELLARPAGDIDLLVDDARRAHAALCSEGFVLTGHPGHVEVHHLRPLIWRNVPVRIELHHAPKWVDGLKPPSISELFDLAVPARGDAEGFETLAPAAHAVIVAVHAWAHEPLGSLRNLIDVALLKAEARDREAEVLAQRWGVSDIWNTTTAVVEALFAGGRRPLTMRLWARHLEAARGRTVAESHLERLMSPFWAFPVRSAVQHAARRIAEEVQPVPGEFWRTKFSRARLAVINAGAPRFSHERVLEELGLATPPVLYLDRVERRHADNNEST